MQCSEAINRINNLNRTIPLRRIGVDLQSCTNCALVKICPV